MSTGKNSRKKKKRSVSTQRHPARSRKPAHFAPNHSAPVSWISGARLRTLPLAIAPVVIGASAASVVDKFSWLLTALCLVVTLCLQIGVNYANDYSDGVRGTDAHRVGPGRLTGSGSAKPRTVLTVALSFFAVAILAGLAITVITQIWWLPAAGLACVAAAWFYTGGKRPYGYMGLGELSVFVFFGLVATAGTMFVQAGTVSDEAWLGSAGIGFIACAVLVINNARDIETDRLSGKRTLATRMGRRGSVVFYIALMVLAMAVAGVIALFFSNAWLVQFAWLIVAPACVIAAASKSPAEDILVLRLSTVTGLLYGLGLGAAIAF
jgi:1,4-dihydroxy-2-naphthoate octaprenyltransferase